jgi:predicted glutamine amidotransferase
VLHNGVLDGLKEKAAKAAEKVGQTAGSAAEAVGKATNAVVEHANETVESTKEDLRDEPTPEETRAKLDAMADVALQRTTMVIREVLGKAYYRFRGWM